MRQSGFLERLSGACWGLGMNSGFQITIEVLVGIEFWAIGRQPKKAHPAFRPFNPLLNRFAVMDPQIVEHQKDLAINVIEESAQKFDENIAVEVLFVEHKPDFALVGDA